MKPNKLIAIFLVLTFILSNAGFRLAFAQEPLVLSDLIETALKSNPEILSYQKKWEAARMRIPQQKTLDNPIIGITYEKIPRGTFDLGGTMPEDRMLTLQQMLPFFGKLPLKGKIAIAEAQMAAAEYKTKELEVINEVKQAYYGLFLNYKEIELNQESLKFLENIAKIAEAKYATGEIPQEEVLKINLELAKLSNGIKNLKQENSSIQTRLNAILNRKPDSKLGYPALEENAAFWQDINQLYKLTLENQPELQIFQYAIKRNVHAKALAKRQFFPDLMAGVSLRGLGSPQFGLWDLMLALVTPLWFWNKERYGVKEAIANLESAKAAYEAMKNRALFETKDLATKIEIAKNKINLSKANLIPILESSIRSSLSAYTSGRGDFMMLLDSERMLVETRMDYYKALAEYHMNLADLEKVAGVDLLKETK